MIYLTFLGWGAAFFPELGNTAAWMKREKDFYLIDCGGDVFAKVYQLKEYWETENLTVLLTHMHGDHVGSLPELISYTWFKRGIKSRVIYPDSRLETFLTLCGVGAETYSREDCLLGGEIQVFPLPVFHDPSMGCFGYQIQDRDETIYYSGDSGLISEKWIELLRSGQISRLYLDTAKHADVGSGHGNFDRLKATASRELRGRIVCIHLDCAFAGEIEREGFLTPGHLPKVFP